MRHKEKSKQQDSKFKPNHIKVHIKLKAEIMDGSKIQPHATCRTPILQRQAKQRVETDEINHVNAY